jgi:prephenate dehydratase
VGCLHAQLRASTVQPQAQRLFIVHETAAAAVKGEDADNTPMQAMARERAATSFEVRRLTHALEGEEGTRWLELAAQLIERDPVLHDGHPHDLTVPEHRERSPPPPHHFSFNFISLK